MDQEDQMMDQMMDQMINNPLVDIPSQYGHEINQLQVPHQEVDHHQEAGLTPHQEQLDPATHQQEAGPAPHQRIVVAQAPKIAVVPHLKAALPIQMVVKSTATGTR